MNKKILVVAVHPDDETLGCGGTVLKHKEKKDEVFWLILTKANQTIAPSENIVEKQKVYVKKIAKAYKFDGWKQLDFLSTELDKYPMGELISAISAIMNKIKPNVLYFNHFSDIHSDHRIAFEAIYACTKNFRYPFIEKILLFETLSETEFAPAIRNNAFVPNVFIDVSLYMDKKLDVWKLYNTEQMNEPYPRSISSIKALGRYRGSTVGVEYAEAFVLLKEIL